MRRSPVVLSSSGRVQPATQAPLLRSLQSRRGTCTTTLERCTRTRTFRGDDEVAAAAPPQNRKAWLKLLCSFNRSLHRLFVGKDSLTFFLTVFRSMPATGGMRICSMPLPGLPPTKPRSHL